MADVDATQAIITLLTDNWNSSNTDSVTPTFSKIFQQPKNDMNFDKSRDFVLAYNSSTETKDIGIGGTAVEDVFETVNIDIRSFGKRSDTNGLTDDGHVRKVRYEIDRILKTNKVNPDSNFNELDTSQNWLELNDRYRGIFRFTKIITLTQWCRDFSV